jgi:hypothetical protein
MRRAHNKGGRLMNFYKFNCNVWVRGETAADALSDLHEEVDYLFKQDNNLIALESNKGVKVEDIDT